MNFKVMDWLRKTRDKDFEVNKNKTPKEKIENTKKNAEEFKKQLLKQKANIGKK